MSFRQTFAPRIHEHDPGWPVWIPVTTMAAAAIAGLTAVHQRSMQGRSVTGPLLFAALIALPFVLDAIAHFTRWPIELPLWLFPIPVLIGTGFLVFQPAQADFAPFVLVLMTAEVASRAVDRRIGIFAGLSSCLVMVAVDVVGPFSDSFIWVIGISGGLFAGLLIQTLDAKTHELQIAQAGLSEKAAAEERSRIAREVHDVIAHSLSVTMLHVTAARMAVEKNDALRDQALDSLREAERQGRRSLTEIRRTVGLLGDDPSGAAPMPKATDLPALVEELRHAGLDVSIALDGDIPTLPDASGLALYRIVQESLTNVAKHAPGARTHVALNVTEDEITLRVHNSLNGDGLRPAAGNGMGLRGMAERAAVLGGTFEADSDETGWTVLVRAPRVAPEPE